MSAIRIRKTIDSDTLMLPELRPLIGRTVEIVIEEQPAAILPPGVVAGTGDWAALEEASRELRAGGYDFDAWKRQRQFDLEHAEDHRL